MISVIFDVDFNEGKLSAHGANVVRVNGSWYLLDTTNPDINEGVGEIYMVPVGERDIDPNKQYDWQVPRNNQAETWRYRSRSNMYHVTLPKV